MTTRQLEEFRTILSDLLRRAVTGQLDAVQRGTEGHPDQDEPGDQVDIAERASSVDQFTLMGERQANLAMKIEDALVRITHGTYGTCVDCGRQIELGRLRAVPWTDRCAEDGARAEQQTGRDASPSL